MALMAFCRYAGPLVGLGVMCLFVPVLGILTKKQRSHQKAAIAKTTVRTTHINETVFGVKMIKMYAWIKPLMERITTDRDGELISLRGFSLYKNSTIPLAFMMPSVASIVTFIVYTTVGPGDGTRPDITPDVAFTVISLFAVIGGPFFMIPMGLSVFAQVSVAWERYNNFFAEPQLPKSVALMMHPLRFCLT